MPLDSRSYVVLVTSHCRWTFQLSLHLQVSRDKLVSLGTCIGKFTHSDKFRLTIGALDILAAHAKYKVCFPACVKIAT